MKVVATFDLPCPMNKVGCTITNIEHAGHAHDAEMRVSEDGKYLEIVIPAEDQ